jgi:hypothetical protein
MSLFLVICQTDQKEKNNGASKSNVAAHWLRSFVGACVAQVHGQTDPKLIKRWNCSRCGSHFGQYANPKNKAFGSTGK